MDGGGLLRFLRLVSALFLSFAASSFSVGAGLVRALSSLSWLVVFELAAGALWLSASLAVVFGVAGRLFMWFRVGGVAGVLGGLAAVDGRVVEGGRLSLWRFSLVVGAAAGALLLLEAVFMGLKLSLASVELAYRVSMSLVVLAAALWCLLFAGTWRS